MEEEPLALEGEWQLALAEARSKREESAWQRRESRNRDASVRVGLSLST